MTRNQGTLSLNFARNKKKIRATIYLLPLRCQGCGGMDKHPTTEQKKNTQQTIPPRRTEIFHVNTLTSLDNMDASGDFAPRDAFSLVVPHLPYMRFESARLRLFQAGVL